MARKAGIAAAALVSSLALCPASAAQAQTRGFPDTTNGIFVFEDQLATPSMTEAQFQFAATHYVGTQKIVRDAVRHLRQYNPNFLLLHYRLGQDLGHSVPDASCNPTTSYISIVDGNSWIQEWPGDAAVSESWFFHVSGSRVFNCSWGHYLMELDDAGWRAWWSTQVIGQLQDGEADGVFADSFSIPNALGPWKPALAAYDPTLEADWAQREHAFTDYIRSRFAGQWKWIPNVGSYITTRDPSDYSNVDGVMFEGFAESGNGGWYALGDWQLQMNRALALIRADRIVIGQTYPSAADVEERLFALGTYLLVKGSHTYVNLEIGQMPEWFPEYRVDLGPPLDPLPTSISGFWNPTWGVYQRRYARGIVLVNPTGTSQTLSLPAAMLRVVPSGGGFVPSNGAEPGSLAETPVTSVTLDPHRAVILKNVPIATRFFSVPPCRLLDTRNPAGPLGGPALAAGATRTLVAAGTCGVPATARSIAVNVAVTAPTAAGFLTFFPAGQPLPNTSTVNYRAGQTRANNAIVGLGAAGDVNVFSGQLSGSTQIVIDVEGYFQE